MTFKDILCQHPHHQFDWDFFSESSDIADLVLYNVDYMHALFPVPHGVNPAREWQTLLPTVQVKLLSVNYCM